MSVNLDLSFDVENGLSFAETDVAIFSGSVNPGAGGGTPAPVGSLFLRNDGNLYAKIGALNTDWAAALRQGDVQITIVPPSAGLSISGGPIVTSGTLTFSLSNDLAALEALTGTGFAARTGADSWANRTITGGTNISITNADGLSGNPTISLSGTVGVGNGGTGLSTTPSSNQLLVGTGTGYSLATLTAGTGVSISNSSGTLTITNAGVTSLAGTTNQITASASTGAVTLSLPSNVIFPGDVRVTSGNLYRRVGSVTAVSPADPATAPTLIYDINLVGGTGGVILPSTSSGRTVTIVNYPSSSGVTVYTQSGNFAPEGGASFTLVSGGSVTVTSDGGSQWRTVDKQISITASSGLTVQSGGSATTYGISLNNNMLALDNVSTTGIIVKTGSTSWASRSIVGPSAGITVTNGDGVSGNPTLALANDLAALEALSFNGFAVRTVTDTWATRSLAAGTGIGITNPSGAAAGPTITNTGVTSLAGTTNQITASASTGAVTLSVPSTFVAPGSVQVTSNLHESIDNAVTAAGTNQATATAIASRHNIVTTVAAGTGVVLPTPTSPFGTQVYIDNRGANALNVYPNTGAAIENGATNAALVLQPGQEATFVSGSATQWWVTEPVINAGSNVTVTTGPGTLTIAATTGGSPGGANTNIQFNNSGAFGGASTFNYITGTNARVESRGTDLTTQLAVGLGNRTFSTAVLDGSNNATVFIQNNGDTTSEGLRCHFRRTTAGTSGWITYDYDQNAPNIRLTDEDDDSPYLQFNTIGTGTYTSPQYTSIFGARGPVGTRTGGNNSGFAWLVGSSTTPGGLWSAANYSNALAMELDRQWLRLPNGTTAQRPATGQPGMMRFNTTLGRVEAFSTEAGWTNLSDLLNFQSYSISPQQVVIGTATALSGTAPNNTAGVEIFSQTYTPTRVGSRLYIDYKMFVASGTNGRQVNVFLYIDGGTAVSGSGAWCVTANTNGAVIANSYETTTTSLSPITISLRLTATATATFQVNRFTTTNDFGGVFASRLSVAELEATP